MIKTRFQLIKKSDDIAEWEPAIKASWVHTERA